MSLLLRWHSQHGSVMGLEHIKRGRSWSHRLRKVEVATHLCSDSLIASWYCLWMSALVQLVAFVGGDSAGEDEGMPLCIGGDEVCDPLDIIQVQDPGIVIPTTRLLLSADNTVFLVPPDGVGDLVEADTGKVRYLR